MSTTPAQSRTRTVHGWEPADDRRPAAQLPHHVHGPQSPDEVVIGVALTTQWMLTTGRRLDQAPLLHDLTDDQLIDFWADDHQSEITSTPSPARRVMCDNDAAQRYQPTTSRPAGSQTTYVPMFAVDIVSYSQRDPDIQKYVRDVLYRIVPDSCRAGGLPWDHCHHEDRGDAIFVLTPAGTGIEVLLDVVNHLRAGLRTHNKIARPAAQIQLRTAIHAGYVNHDAHGVSGNAANHLFRMLDAPDFRSEFARHGGDLALVVSDHLYREVVQYSPGPINPDSLRPINVTVKETHERGWLWLPPESRSRRRQTSPTTAPDPPGQTTPELHMTLFIMNWPPHEAPRTATPADPYAKPRNPGQRQGRGAVAPKPVRRQPPRACPADSQRSHSSRS